MKRVVVAIAGAASLLGGCSFGLGSAFVGQWRPRDRVDFDACLLDGADRCAKHKQVTTHVPGREFWGVLIAYPAAGFAVVSQGGARATRARLAPSLEVMAGTGRFAAGARVAAQIEFDGARAMPIVALAHLSLAERLSVYGGGGYLPYARLHGESAFVGAQGIAGVQLALSRTRAETYIVASVEADATWIAFAEHYRSNGVTGHLGIFF
jgi:hypothetical protein